MFSICYAIVTPTEKNCLKWGTWEGIGLETIFKCCVTTLIYVCNTYCLKSNTEAFEYHMPISQDPIYKCFHGSHVRNHANSKFPSTVGYYNCWIYFANTSSEAVIFTVFKGSALFSLQHCWIYKKEHLQNLLLIFYCCTDVVACFLLKMYSIFCFCFYRKKKYSFLLGLLSSNKSKWNALGSSTPSFESDVFNMRSHFQYSTSFNIIFLNTQSPTL